MVNDIDAASANSSDAAATAEKPTSRLIDHVDVEVEILLGATQITVAELERLKQGDTIEVDRFISEAADIRVNGRTIGRGEIVTVDDKFAVRITQIDD